MPRRWSSNNTSPAVTAHSPRSICCLKTKKISSDSVWQQRLDDVQQRERRVGLGQYFFRTKRVFLHFFIEDIGACGDDLEGGMNHFAALNQFQTIDARHAEVTDQQAGGWFA